MKVGDTVLLNRDLAPALIGVRCKIVRISGLSTLTLELLEDAKGTSCWKKGDTLNCMPYNVREER